MFWDEKAECMNKEDKEKIQLERLQKTVQLAYENVEFYKKRFDEIVLKPEDIKTLKDYGNCDRVVSGTLKDGLN